MIVLSYDYAHNLSSIEIWDTKSWEQINAFQLNEVTVDIDITPNNKLAIAGRQVSNYKENNNGYTSDVSSNEFVPIWNIQTGLELLRLETTAINVAFDTKGDELAIGSNPIETWDINTRQKVHKFNLLGNDSVNALVFMPKKPILVAGSINIIYVYDIENETELAWLEYPDEVNEVSFNKNGTLLAGGGRQSTVNIWETTNWHQVAVIDMKKYKGRLPEPSIQSISFGENDVIAIATYDTVVVLDLSIQKLIDGACSRLTRNLTMEEWQQYMGDEPYRATCPDLPVPKK